MSRSLATLALILGVACSAASAQTLERTPAPPPAPSIPALPIDRGDNPVADGSFEAGTPNPFWFEQSLQFSTPLCTVLRCDEDMNADAVPRTGEWFSWFGGGGDPRFPERSILSQAVSLPSPTATLNFWLRITTPAPASDGSLEITLGDTDDLNTDSLLTVFTFADQAEFDEYTLVTLPIRRVEPSQLLSFRYENRQGIVRSMFMDDVSIGPPVPGALLVADGRPFPSEPFTVAVVGDSLAFGDVQTDGAVVRTVSLTNLGADPAVVGDITFEGTPGVTVDVAQGDIPASIPPGGQATFRARLTTDMLGPVSGVLTIESNTPGSPATLVVTATGISTTVRSFCAGASVDLPAGPPSVYAGLADPYPSTITVTGVTDPVFDVNVRLVGLSHGVPRHLDLGLVHPQGPSLILLSGVGLATPVNDITVTLDDAGSDELRFFEPLRGETYRPTNVGVGDPPFPAPAPPIPTNEILPRLSIFNDLDPNGAWTLYGRDIEAIGPFFDDQGQMTDWCLDIETTNSVSSVALDVSPEAQSVQRGGQATFTYQVTNTANTAQSGVAFYEVFRAGNRVAGPTRIASGSVPGDSSTPPLTFSVDVPSNAPVGTYSVAISAGPSTGVALTTDRVTVTVTDGAQQGGTATDWLLAEADEWPALAVAATAASEAGAYPNPFASETTIRFETRAAATVRLAVYDVLGREVAVLVDGAVEAGQHEARFDARGLASGLYVYRLEAEGRVESGQITLVK